ncbi:hypothetical protein JTB14_014829 [Gonioctena quinquepunctata]|nr:hypothetical protein JTB14_014829 [Gonioctena quinquepunctata]
MVQVKDKLKKILFHLTRKRKNFQVISEDFPKLDTGDFGLVKFSTKTTIYHYVGRITKKNPDQEYEVTVLKRVGEEYLFIYPVSEDTAIVPEEDIPIKLPQPISRGGTERALLKISFDFDFSSFSDIK